MNILFYCDEYPPAKHGGIGSVIKIVAEALAKRGYRICVFGTYSYGHGLPWFSEINGVKIYRLTHFNFLKFFPIVNSQKILSVLRKIGVLNWIASKAIWKSNEVLDLVIKKENIECVELVDYIDLLKYVNQELNFPKLKVPTVMRVHGSQSFIAAHRNEFNKIFHTNDINNFSRVDRIIAVSNFSKSFVVEDLKFDKDLIDVIYNPIENGIIANFFKKNNSNTILFIGKITETKGAFSLIKAFNILAEKYPDINLSLIGGGNIDLAKKIISKVAVERVHFKGYMARNELLKEIDSCIFGVIPSYFENFSMVPLEIMSRGKALIYTNRASGCEIIEHKINGLLVDPTDIYDIADNIEVLLRDKNLRRIIAENGYKNVKEKFSLDPILSQLENSYHSLITC